MNIVLSAHFDLSHPVMSIQMDKDNLLGLVDNFAGMFVSYDVSRKTGTKVYFTNFEELEFDGAIDVAKSLDKNETIVIVVDTTTDAEGKAAYIGNVYGLEMKNLEEKFADKILFKKGMYEETEDETYIYGQKFGFKTFYFGVPINPNYHDVDNKVSLKTMDAAAETLIEVITELQKNI